VSTYPTQRTYPTQLELQLPLLQVLAEAGGEATSRAVQDALAERFALPEHLRAATAEVGPGNRINRWGRHVRWAQQRARLAGYTTAPAAGVWRLSRSGEQALGNQRRGMVVTVAVTGLGVLVWAHAEDLAGVLDDGSVQLFFSSPPFPLNRRKEYANQHPARSHVEWLLRLVERYLRKLAPEGSIVLEVGPVWTPGEPTQATWMERLVVALEDRLGLHLCQTLYWENPAKMPGPAAWTTRERVRLTDRIERLLWTGWRPRPGRTRTTARSSRPIPRRCGAFSVAAAKPRSGVPPGTTAEAGPSAATTGAPSPARSSGVANTASNDRYTRACREAGLPVHPARFPEELPGFVIRFLTREDDLVVDPMCGSGRTARAADRLARRWVCGDIACEYLRGAAFQLDDLPGFVNNFGPRPGVPASAPSRPRQELSISG
jgi:hypothetical protein